MRRIHFLFIFLFLLIISGCSRDGTPFSFIEGKQVATPSGATLLKLVSEMEDFQVKWESPDGGYFHDPKGPKVIWRAPEKPGIYRIDVTVTGDLLIDTLSIYLEVVSQPPLRILEKDILASDKGKKAILAFKNEDTEKRSISDFSFSMILFSEKNYQGRHLIYLEEDLYQGSPNREDDLPILFNSLYEKDEWDLRWAPETQSILPWVNHIEYSTGEIWNLYEEK